MFLCIFFNKYNPFQIHFFKFIHLLKYSGSMHIPCYKPLNPLNGMSLKSDSHAKAESSGL